MTYAEILARVESVTGHAPQATSTGHQARCPAHDDRSPSLSLSVGNDGRTLAKCHANCEFDAVVSALGLTPVDFYDKAPELPAWDPKRDGYETTATYVYTDADGAPLFEKLRREPKPGHPARGHDKTFMQRRRDPANPSRWSYKLGDCARPLYRLPEVLAAVGAGRVVFVVEGEKDADNLAELGFVATCNDGGASKDKWKRQHTEALKGARVAVLPDHDASGRDHARAVCASLDGVAESVVVVALASLPSGAPAPPKFDVSDWLAAGGTPKALKELVRKAPPFADSELVLPAQTEPQASEPSDDDKPKRRTASSVLVDLVTDKAELWHDAEGEPHISFITPGGGREHHPLRTKAARRFMGRLYYLSEGKAPGGQATDDAFSVLEGRAIWDGPEYRTAVRAAVVTDDAGGERLYLDLGDDTGRVVETTAGGWSIVSGDACAVRFVRRPGLLPLPDPVAGGSVDDLRAIINTSETGFGLIVGWLLCALHARPPFPILGFSGEQGTGKSTAARYVRRLVDPNVANLRDLPRNAREAYISTAGSLVQVYDNVSRIQPAQSDVLCRLASGGGYAVRALHTDADEAIFNEAAPQILTGIGDVVTRPDLAERTLAVPLERIGDESRQTEAALDAAFDAAQPRVLGALLDAASDGLRLLRTTNPGRLPRLADAARWVIACEAGGKIGAPGSFMSAFNGAREELVEAALDAEPIAGLIRQLRDDAKPEPGMTVFKGTSAELLDRLVLLYRKDDEKRRLPAGWPTSARGLSSAVTRSAPPLRSVGIDCERTKAGRGDDRQRVWIVRHVSPEKGRSQPSPPSPPSPGAEKAPVGSENANYAGPVVGTVGDAESSNRPQPSPPKTPNGAPIEGFQESGAGGDGGDGCEHAFSGNANGAEPWDDEVPY